MVKEIQKKHMFVVHVIFTDDSTSIFFAGGR